jgi:hypothetical protein
MHEFLVIPPLRLLIPTPQETGAGIAQWFQRRATGSTARVRFLARDFSVFHSVHTGSGTYPEPHGGMFPLV